MKVTRIKPWLILFGLQVVVILAIFSSFLSGQFYFAYTDIGSDTFGFYTPIAMHMARTLARDGFTGWSFGIGLGSATGLWLADVFAFLTQLGGPDGVLPLRIWVYVLKLVLGGAAFLLLLRGYVTRWETQVIGALAYTFCGYIVINGQWDSEATVFIFLPLVLLAITAHLRDGRVLWLPLAVAAALVSGAFFVSLAVFLMLVCLAFVLSSDQPQAMFKTWVTRIFPLTLLGYLLAAPALLPVMLQMMDSSRVSGGQNLFDNVLGQSLRINEWSLILAELGGLFHKDIFGIGSAYKGYWNYLEGPGFFMGILLLLVIPQLWRGSAAERKVLLVGLAAVAAYVVFPVFRFAAMGFAVPYFRVSTLWVTLVLLLLAARAVDQILTQGVNGRLLAVGAGVLGALLALVNLGSMSASVWTPHVVKVIGLALLACAVLVLAQRKLLLERALPFVLMAVVVLEALLIARPSYLEGRQIVSPQHSGYDDSTTEALRVIRGNDPGVFRIEKTYDSVTLADALAQDYMGIKSYSFHGRGVVDFNVAMGLIAPPQAAPSVNYTNWLPNAGPRFMLNSLLGVKYLIAREDLQWPGYKLVSKRLGYQIYRNDMALPLGVVQTLQVTTSAFTKLASLPEREAQIFRDITVMNAVVVTELDPAHGLAFDLDSLVGSNALTLERNYFAPAQVLQGTGLRIQTFASNHIVGTINPTKPGILVFSIPFNQGWSLKVDGVATPMMRANFGMLAAPVAAGTHAIELEFQLPGQRMGAVLGVLGLGLLVWLGFTRGRFRKCEQESAIQVLH